MNSQNHRAMFSGIGLLCILFLFNNCTGDSIKSTNPEKNNSSSNIEFDSGLNALKSAGWSVGPTVSNDLGVHTSKLESGQFLVAQGNQLRKLNTNFSLDTTFGSEGVVMLPGAARALTVSGSNIFIASTSYGSDYKNVNLMVQKLNIVSGEPDLTFGNFESISGSTPGVLKYKMDLGYDILTYLALRIFSNGDLLIVSSFDTRIWAFRVGSNGKKLVFSEYHISTTFKIYARDVLMLPDDKYLVSGYTNKVYSGVSSWGPYSASVPYLYAARFLNTGKLDTSFANSGQITPDYYGVESPLHKDDYFYSFKDYGFEREAGCCIFKDSSNRIHLTRIIASDKGGLGGLIIVRLTDSGQLDAGFGDNGKVIIFPRRYHVDYKQAFIQSNGKILFVGGARDDKYYETSSYSRYYKQAAILRLNSDFTIDTSYGDNGIHVFGSAKINESIESVYEDVSGLTFFGRVFIPKYHLSYQEVESSGTYFYKKY